MMCCGGGEEDIYSQPMNPSVTPPTRNAPGNDREPRDPTASKSGAPQKVLPIEIPAIPLAELNRLTNNFGPKALIGEGSYGKVYQATLSSGAGSCNKEIGSFCLTRK
ncbi:hypothetical protein HPP92_016184 [Vanilla planifolia]|uniref:Uncharacterized protein n=1 Tax=Vanilla planifolia TaxID=51239 RepID=A0A835QH30_VANPL|nr:hypothetical protein HPP92_016184 [Vanilla planifolia]